MKKIFISLFLVALATNVTLAKQRTLAEMKSEAVKVITSSDTNAPLKAKALQGVKVLHSETQLSLVGFENGAFAVIANDDVFQPVLGYTTGRAGAEHAPGFVWWLETMNKSLEDQMAEGKAQAKVQRASDVKTAVAPLIKTKWGQGAPYNNMCPEYTVGGTTKRYVTGCVATSMAQVMNYHGYPTKGTGSTSYRYTPQGGAILTLRANFGTTSYGWANMADDYSNGGYTAAQAEAVATLMSHCGIAVHMNYNASGSGAMSHVACRALKKYFNYSAKIGCLYREFFHVDEWMNIIYKELSDGCPIIYGGNSGTGGHSFVFDGYDEDGLVSVNWGWEGVDDGYFDIASLNGYNDIQDMVIVRLPDDDRMTQDYTYLWASQSQFYVTQSGNTLTVNDAALVCMETTAFLSLEGDEEFRGNVAFVATDLSTGNLTVLAAVVDNNDAFQYGQGVIINNLKADISSLPVGEYRLYFASRSVEEAAAGENWNPLRSKEGVSNSYILTVTSSGASLRQEESSAWTGIEYVEAAEAKADGRVYSIDGRYVGNSIESLGKGLYIVNGRKVMK